jgi:hypothetical protein
MSITQENIASAKMVAKDNKKNQKDQQQQNTQNHTFT